MYVQCVYTYIRTYIHACTYIWQTMPHMHASEWFVACRTYGGIQAGMLHVAAIATIGEDQRCERLVEPHIAAVAVEGPSAVVLVVGWIVALKTDHKQCGVNGLQGLFVHRVLLQHLTLLHTK